MNLPSPTPGAPAPGITRAGRALSVLRKAAPHAVRHEALVSAVWPGSPPASTAAGLTHVVHLLRRAGHPVERVRGGYRLPEAEQAR